MTDAFDTLRENPSTGFTRGDFSLDERQLIRVLDVTGGPGSASSGDHVGSFTPVYYLEGDESAAARVFAEENAGALERVDFSAQNVVSSSVPRSMYDLILHHAGERVRTLYPTVVREDRPSGVTWILDREHYEETTEGRYSTGSGGVARVPAAVSLESVFESAGSVVQSADVCRAGVEGSVQQVLDYYRCAGRFSCSPTTVGSELAVAKS